jgi:hypothetical protein
VVIGWVRSLCHCSAECWLWPSTTVLYQEVEVSIKCSETHIYVSFREYKAFFKVTYSFCNPILFAICTSKFRKLCKMYIGHVEEWLHLSSRQRGRPTDTRPQISDSNIPTGSNIWSLVPQGCLIPRHTDWLVSRKVTSTSTSRCKLTSSQQSGIKYVSPNTSPYLCFFFLFLFSFLWNHLRVVLQKFYL